ncbi:hypothetical protein [Pontibacter chitinilyticus]|uniref:hypothetical protein n=1 Tax=Pontibacter chitinilyticus TaxID=2674989 RepID=UPI00321AAF68
MLLQKYHTVSGAKVWEKDLGRSASKTTGDKFELIESTRDQGYIISTNLYSGFELIKADAEGNVVWRNKEVYNARAITETADGDFYAVGSGAGKSYLYKVDASGQLQWRKVFRSTEITESNAIIKTRDNNFLVVGWAQNSQNYKKDVLVVSLDASGNELWNRKLDIAWNDEAYAVTEATNGDFIIAGYAQDFETEIKSGLLIRLSPDGQTAWSKTYGETDVNYEMAFIEHLADETFITLGTKGSQAYRATFEKDGTLITEEKMPGGKAFSLKNTPLQQTVVVELSPCLIVYRGKGQNVENCGIQTSITASGETNLCPGESLTLSAGEGFASYKWSTGETTRSITANQTGEYRVEVTNEIGCLYATEPVTVTIGVLCNGRQRHGQEQDRLE